MQRDLFGPEVLGLSSFVSKETTRFSLTGVQLKPGRAVATNGKMMLIIPTQKTDDFPEGDWTPEMKPLPKEGVIVSPDALKKAFGFAAKRGPIDVLKGIIAGVVGKDTTVVTLVGTDLETSGQVKARILEGTYPDVDAVFPKGKTYEVCLDPKLLKEFIAYAMKYGDKKDSTIRLSFNREHPSDRAVKIDFLLSDGRLATGILMPLKKETVAYDPPKPKDEASPPPEVKTPIPENPKDKKVEKAA